jgi:hypothetical protein
MAPPPAAAKRNSPRRKKTAAGDSGKRHWRHWVRVLLLLILVVVPGTYGFRNLPRTPEAPELIGPSIVVLASQARVAATVNMVLSVGLGADGQSSQLQLTVLPASGINLPLTLTVELNDFPAGTTGVSGTQPKLPVIQAPAATSPYSSLAEAAPPPPEGYQDYAVTEPITSTSTPPPPITIMAPNTPIGEATAGAQLRVAFPDLVGEAPGANPSAGYQLGSLYSGAQASKSATTVGYPLALQAGTSWFKPGGIRLADYQILAGDSPVPLGGDWRWAGVNDVTVLAANVGIEDKNQDNVFYAGVALGLAAGAVITLLVELFWDRPEEKKKTGQPPASDAVISGE